jgi:hypothetical protein
MQCTVATGTAPPAVLTKLAAATRIPIVGRATHSLGLLVSTIEGTHNDDDTVEAVLEEAE